MKILDVGHKFELLSIDGNHKQILTFLKRKGLNYPGNDSFYPGTTTQDVIHCLLNRTRYVNNQIPCIENEIIISNLQQCLFALESRAAKRHNLQFDPNSLQELEMQKLCKTCGHLTCEHLNNLPTTTNK